MCPQYGPDLRLMLLKATQDVSYSRGLYVPLQEYIRQYPKVEYIPNSGNPISINGDTRWSSDTWLLQYDRFERGGNVYEWAPQIVLMLGDKGFDAFFAFKWRSVDINQSNAFLLYHQQQHYWESRETFVSFLRKLIIKYRDILTPLEYNELLDEYTKLNVSGQAITETPAGLKSIEVKLPKVPARRNGDSKTTLSQKETLGFFSYLREAGIILKDKSYLSQSNVHKAIQVLTGYSDTNMRKAEVSASISKVELQNLKKITNVLIRMIYRDLAIKMGPKK